MARKFLFVFLLSLTASSILARGIGKNDNDADDAASSFLNSVKDNNKGGESPDAGQKRPKEQKKFNGDGHRVGKKGEETEVVPNEQTESEEAEEKVVSIVIRLWRQGFTIDDGPLRPYEEQENKEFLQCLENNVLPRELRDNAEYNGKMLEFSVQDRRKEDYKAPKPKAKPFEGKGNSLHGPVKKQNAAGVSQSDIKNAENEKLAKEKLNVDETKPTTTLQVRLADGTRLSVRVNLSHTVKDLRTFIVTARPQYKAKAFTLSTSFPSKELTDLDQTIEEAGLKNAVVAQRLKQ